MAESDDDVSVCVRRKRTAPASSAGKRTRKSAVSDAQWEAMAALRRAKVDHRPAVEDALDPPADDDIWLDPEDAAAAGDCDFVVDDGQDDTEARAELQAMGIVRMSRAQQFEALLQWCDDVCEKRVAQMPPWMCRMAAAPMHAGENICGGSWQNPLFFQALTASPEIDPKPYVGPDVSRRGKPARRCAVCCAELLQPSDKPSVQWRIVLCRVEGYSRDLVYDPAHTAAQLQLLQTAKRSGVRWHLHGWCGRRVMHTHSGMHWFPLLLQRVARGQLADTASEYLQYKLLIETLQKATYTEDLSLEQANAIARGDTLAKGKFCAAKYLG